MNKSPIDHVVTAINNLPDKLKRNAAHTRILNTQIPNFPGSENKLLGTELPLLNHLRPHQNRFTEEHRLYYILSFLHDEALDFWQTLRITPKRKPKVVLEMYRKEFAKDHFKEVSNFKWDQLGYDPKNIFSDFLKTLQKTKTPGFGDRVAGLTETFFYGKLPVQIQHELSTAGKSEASVQTVKYFIQRRLQ